MSFGGFSPSAQVRPTTAVEVLNAVVSKLRSNIQILGTETTCFISDTPEPSIECQDNLYATVSVGNGQFDQGLMDGGGNLQVVELMTLQVTVFSMIKLDRLEHFSSGMTNPRRGLLVLKQQILMALAGKNLDGGTYNGNSSLLLLESLGPSRSVHPMSKGVNEKASFSLAFDAKFSWNLNSDSALV